MLEIVRAATMDQLARRCAAALAEPPADPFEPEWIATPSPGVARWLSLELARDLGATGADDGITANITFARSGDLRRALLDAGAGDAGIDDPWYPERILWTLARLLADRGADLGLPPLGAGATLTGRARRITGLFARYDTHRPAMLRAWAAGRDESGDGHPLAAEHRWQPRLFRALREHLGVPSPAERLPDLIGQLESGASTLALPRRFAFFGFTSMPGGADFAALVDAAATSHDVRCYLLDPAPTTDAADWDGLLRSWGAAAAANRQVLTPVQERVVTLAPSDPEPTHSTLAKLQGALRGQTVERTPPDPGDDSIRIHGAQGARRQVEVLRDALCARLRSDQDLDEDDIVVWCGDLERFTPLIHTVFGRDGASTRSDAGGVPAGTPALRYRIEGAPGGPENPVVVAVRAALEAISGRFSALDVIEFCGLEAVRRRWGFDDDSLAVIRRWITDLDVRWGFDTDQREHHGVPAGIVAGTWHRALDRLALGVAFARDDLIVGDALVPAAVEGDRIHLLGRLVDLVGRLAELARQATVAMPVADRLRSLEIQLEALVAAEDDADWQLDALRRMCRVDYEDGSLRDWVGGLETTLAQLRPELLRRLQSGSGRSGAFRGGITFTTPSGLAGVPFDLVCLLGLDDGAVPTPVRDGDDLLALAPRPGDPDPRAATLAATLATVGAAGAALEVVHDVRDLATNQDLPDSVALAELWTEILGILPAGDDAVSRVRITHPRHGSDPACFRPGALVADRPWSFDQLALTGARARLARGGPSDPGGAGPDRVSVDAEAPLVDLADLASFFENPARFLCRKVLDVRLPSTEDDLEGHLRTGLSPLESYEVLRDLFERRLAEGEDFDSEALLRLFVAGDRLPVGVTASREFDRLNAEAALMAEAVREAGVGPTEQIPVRVELPDGRTVAGEVTGHRHGSGWRIVDVSPSREKIGHRLRAWVELLALSVAHPDTVCTSVMVRRSPSTGSNRSKKAQPPALVDLALEGGGIPEWTAALARMVEWFEAFCRWPEAISFQAYAGRLSADGGGTWTDADPDAQVDRAWDGDRRYSGELTFLAAGRSLAAIAQAPPRPEDPVVDPDDSRLGAFLADLDAHWRATVLAADDGEDET